MAARPRLESQTRPVRNRFGLVSSARNGWFIALGRLPSTTAKISSIFLIPVRIKSPFSTHQANFLVQPIERSPTFSDRSPAQLVDSLLPPDRPRRSMRGGGRSRDDHHVARP